MKIFSIQVDSIPHIPKIHGRCPADRFAPTGRTPPDLKKERMSLRQAKSRVVNSDPSVRAIDVISVTPVWGRRVVVPCRESPHTLEMLPALDRTAKNVSSSLRLPICQEVALTRHRFWRQQTQLSPRSTS